MVDDKPEDFGKQKLWSSIGWGVFSIIIGWLVDVFSVGKNEKDYSPVFYSGILLTIFSLYVVTKIKVRYIFIYLTIFDFMNIGYRVIVRIGNRNNKVKRQMEEHTRTVY